MKWECLRAGGMGNENVEVRMRESRGQELDGTGETEGNRRNGAPESKNAKMGLRCQKHRHTPPNRLNITIIQ